MDDELVQQKSERLYDVIWKWTRGELAGTEYKDRLHIDRILDRVVLEGPFIIRKSTGQPIILEQLPIIQ